MPHMEFDIFHEIAMPPLFYRELYKTPCWYLKIFIQHGHFRELGRLREFMKLGISLALLENFGIAVVGTSAECIFCVR